MNKDMLIIFMELRSDRKQSYNQIFINKCIITNCSKFHKGKIQTAKRKGNPDNVVYSDGGGWDPPEVSVNSSEEEERLWCVVPVSF